MRNGSFLIVWKPVRMLETAARLLRLLSLLQARPNWTGRELAERLEVTTRTVRNDVERLRRLG
jgi:predicted DNA-binding transcriptional regulator YafY